MSRPEGAPQRFESYQPVSTLLENLDSRLQIAPWDQLELDLPSHNRVRHIESRQIAPVELILSHHGYEPMEAGNWDRRSLRPFDNYRRGFLNGVDTHAGTVELLVEEKKGMGNAEALLLQYTHNPKDGVDSEGNPEITNDGVANVFLMPDGRIQAFVMLPDGNAQPLYYPFAPEHLRQHELAYPQNTKDAAEKIKSSSPRIHTRHLPLLGKLGKLTSAASEIWLDREPSLSTDDKETIQLSGIHNRFMITKDGIDPVLAEKIGAPVDEHPLAGLLDEALLPKQFEIIELEDYDLLVGSMVDAGYAFPSFFRSHKMGMYFSSTSLWDKPEAAGGIKEILGLNGITDIERGLLIPMEWPEEANHEWDTRLAYVKHQMVLQAYEDLPQEQRDAMLSTCNELVPRSATLRNHTYLNTEIPELDASSPYAFKNYSVPQQEKMLAAFIAGRLTLNKDLYQYWAGPPLQGHGISRGDWVPEGIDALLEENGFWVTRAPASRIHEVAVTGKKQTGELEIGVRPYADADLKIDEKGIVFIQKPVALNEVEILEGFSLRPPLERLHRDIEEVYGIKLLFPELPEQHESDIMGLRPLPERLYDTVRRDVAEVLQMYPPEYIQSLGLEKLKIVTGILENGDTDEDEPSGPRGWARYDEKTIYAGNMTNLKGTIHHEMRHFADSVFNVSGEEWIALNPQGEDAYSGLDYETFDKTREERSSQQVPDGFLSHYSNRNEREDRAAITGNFFANPIWLRSWTTRDPILYKKAEKLMDMLVDESNGLYDKDWLNDVLYTSQPLMNPAIYGQLISYGYLTHTRDYLDALQRKARRMGARTVFKR